MCLGVAYILFKKLLKPDYIVQVKGLVEINKFEIEYDNFFIFLKRFGKLKGFNVSRIFTTTY